MITAIQANLFWRINVGSNWSMIGEPGVTDPESERLLMQHLDSCDILAIDPNGRMFIKHPHNSKHQELFEYEMKQVPRTAGMWKHYRNMSLLQDHLIGVASSAHHDAYTIYYYASAEEEAAIFKLTHL